LKLVKCIKHSFYWFCYIYLAILYFYSFYSTTIRSITLDRLLFNKAATAVSVPSVWCMCVDEVLQPDAKRVDHRKNYSDGGFGIPLVSNNAQTSVWWIMSVMYLERVGKNYSSYSGLFGVTLKTFASYRQKKGGYHRWGPLSSILPLFSFQPDCMGRVDAWSWYAIKSYSRVQNVLPTEEELTATLCNRSGIIAEKNPITLF